MPPRWITPLVLLLVVAWATGARAEIAAPQGMVVLTITGKITHTNVGQAAEFDLAMLEAIGGQEATVTDFAETGPGRQRFTGVPMAKLLDKVGADGQTVTALALDAYERELSVEELTGSGAILAYKRNGAYLKLDGRDFGGRGPLWIIYPLDATPALRKLEDVEGRFVYQLIRLDVK